MDNTEKAKKKAKKSVVELEKYAQYARERLLVLLRGMPANDMVAKIRELDFSDRSLNFLCGSIAMETEDYEICAAVEKVKKERAMKKGEDTARQGGALAQG